MHLRSEDSELLSYMVAFIKDSAFGPGKSSTNRHCTLQFFDIKMTRYIASPPTQQFLSLILWAFNWTPQKYCRHQSVFNWSISISWLSQYNILIPVKQYHLPLLKKICDHDHFLKEGAGILEAKSLNEILRGILPKSVW